MLKKFIANLTQARTKREWLKLLAYTLLVVGLAGLAIITGLLLTKRAPFEFNADQLTVAYLQERQELAGLKQVSDLSGFIQPDVAYIGYYTDDGTLEEDEFASGVLVSEDIAVYDQLLEQFIASTPGCEYSQQKVRGEGEYLEALCTDAILKLYAYKNVSGGIIAFSSDLESDQLGDILRSY